MVGAGSAGCWPRTWTALLRLDRLRARFRWSNRSQSVQRQPDGPGVGVLTRAGGVAVDAGAPKVNGQDALGRGRRRHGRQPGPACQRAGPGRGRVHRQRRPSRSDNGASRRPDALACPPHQGGRPAPGSQKCPESAQTPHPSQQAPSDSLEPCRPGERRRAGEHRSCRIRTLPPPRQPHQPNSIVISTELDGYFDRTRSSYLPNSMVITTELGEHGSTGRAEFNPGSVFHRSWVRLCWAWVRPTFRLIQHSAQGVL